MHRFFVSADQLQQDPVVLAGAQAHQVRRVLRLRPGDRVLLLDNCGQAYEAALLAYEATDAHFRLLQGQVEVGEPRVHITLYQAALKGERFDWLLQKGTEIGISRFVPMICTRNVVEDRAAIDGKHRRWERIIQAAAEQCGRARLPELAPSIPYAAAVAQTVDPCALDQPLIRLIPWEAEPTVGLRAALSACNLLPDSRIQVFVGPEGGFTEDEVLLAQQWAIRPVSLGPRILRAETAGLVTATAILYEAGEMIPPEGSRVAP